ncbi:MAG: efflux transporter outer membrane subunit [Methylococcales bacterium]|nr:efflux transporter outer membrane subunit [Methylococcales bacterium]
MKRFNPLLFCLPPIFLSACSGGWLTTVGPEYQTPSMPASTSWQTPQVDADALPIAHDGNQASLLAWWDGFQDPALSRLQAAAQQQSPTVANAGAKIAQSRASLVGSDAALLPSLDGNLAGKRSSASFGGPAFLWTQYQAGLQSNWELDLFGGLSRQQEAANSQLASREAAWHDARVAVAVEVANAYLAYRYCELQLQLTTTDAESRTASAKLTESAGLSGFRAQTDVVLARASAEEGNSAVLQYQAQCERSIKGLVALSGLEESEVRQLLLASADKIGKLPAPPPFRIDALPANVLRQRPDVAAAERDMAEACANIGVEQAKRYPKLSLSGNITPTLQNMNGSALMLAQTWSFGPTLNLPIFDAGKRAANVASVRAQYDAAVSNYRSKVRTAVKEVEEALVRLQSAGQRLPLAQAACQDYQNRLQAAQTLQRAGLGSLLEVETARRSLLAAERTQKELEQEKVSAWIALYRAAGGGWENQAIRQIDTVGPGQPKQLEDNHNGENS